VLVLAMRGFYPIIRAPARRLDGRTPDADHQPIS